MTRSAQMMQRTVLALMALLSAIASVSAQGLSDRQITIVVPYTAGTGIDICARIIGEEMQRRWGQAIVVENKPGASGNIGTTYAATRPADGHTLLMIANTFVTNVSLFKSLSYDPERSFAPIALVATGALALAVHPSLGVDAVTAFIAASKREGVKFTYASPGRGTPQHLAMELFKQRAGADLAHVPYSGSAGAVRDLMGGHVAAMFMPVHTVLPLARSGELKVLAVASNVRAQMMPSVPTLAETGLNDADVDLWYGLLAPAGVPETVVARINQTVNDILAQPAVREKFALQGLETRGGGLEILARLISADRARWAVVIRDAAITPE